MHLLPVERGVIDGGDQAVDLGQSPGAILYLSAADSELAMLADAWKRRADVDPPLPSLRLANYLQLKHHFSVDLYVETMVARAKVVVMRLLGGRSYWPYGVDTIAEAVRKAGGRLLVLPGCPKPDPSLLAMSSDPGLAERLWSCLVEGGPRNADAFVSCLIALARGEEPRLSVERLASAGIYREEAPREAQGAAVLLFYRALLQAGDIAPIDALVEALTGRNLAITAVYVTSLRDPAAVEFLTELFDRRAPDIVLNTTAFAAGLMDDRDPFAPGPFGFDAPWLQVVLSGQSREAWEGGLSGLPARDVAMHIALPEFDGRITSRAVAFKSDGGFDALTELRVVRMAPEPDRIAFVADLAVNWVRLRKLSAADRRVAIILANYPNADHRIANAVGLDTPDSAARLLGHLVQAGYAIDGAPASGRALVDALLAGPTNAKVADREVRVSLPLARYKAELARLPETVRAAVTERWGAPEDDHFVVGEAFALPVLALGHVVVAIQPTRGYGLDVKANYHDAALVPPHGYIAFHIWLREVFGAHAVVHLGKHGNLEWLPGKALALSSDCFPEVALGPMPNIYPFIANDPGEGCQAKRRTAAVVVDHLPPPMTQAESYGVLKALESSIDEYYEAQRLDRRRAELLATRILQEAESLGLAGDLGLDGRDPPEVQLTKLDAYLCDLKEMQIRGGLHVFGEVPSGESRTDMLLSLVRSPRGTARSDRSLIAALADDLDLHFDPLTADRAGNWSGPRPECLADVLVAPWRTNGDTVERLNELARGLVNGQAVDPAWTMAELVLDEIRGRIGPDLDASGRREIEGVLRGLAGQYVPPGPSGAPTRGRPDVLPTGRNFYALDVRTVPTPAAWDIGRAAAELLVERYFQEHGDWPKAIALSAWGTSNLRTGGDDIAQALALMGAQPVWEPGTRRLTGFEIIPLAKLGRPRIDVTLRISGFFRDAFPGQIALIDSVVRALAARDELPGENPIAERVRAESADLTLKGLSADDARRQAAYRIFGAKPGGYGAGLGNLVEADDWDSLDDLADVFLEWGQHAYGSDTEGVAARESLAGRLAQIDAVAHAQDNREHDILDSDDYWQFAGGLAATARVLQGRRLPVYFSDTAQTERPVVRRLDEEVARVVRARAINPKWISAMMRHGHKGAMEISATVDFLFAFAATADVVRDHHFEAVYQAYLGDEAVRDFLARENRGGARRDRASARRSHPSRALDATQ
jgi:cobaltochelatase CobN